MSPEVISADISNFVKDAFKSDGVDRYASDEFLEFVQTYAQAGADGLFLLVSCRVNEILQNMHEPDFDSTPSHIKKLMQRQFYPVMDYFGSMLDPLSESPSMDKGITILNLLLVAQVPPTRRELSTSFMFAQKAYPIYTDYVLDEEKPSDIFKYSKDLCKSTLEIQGLPNAPDSTIGIIHETVRELLRSNGVSDPPFLPSRAKFLTKIGAVKGHVTMAKACLRLLVAPMNTDELREEITESRSFMWYATHFWPLHVKESSDSVVEYQDLLSNFFKADGTGYSLWCELVVQSKPDRATATKLLHRSVLFTLVEFDMLNVLECITPTKRKGFVALGGFEIDLDSFAGESATALSYAIASEKSDIALRLLELGADAETGADGYSAVHFAAWFGLPEVLRKCAESGISFDSRPIKPDESERDVTGMSPLFLCISGPPSNWRQCVELMLDLGASEFFLKSIGWSILHEAAQNGNLEIVRTIVQERSLLSVNMADNDGNTPLMAAASCENGLEVVRFLLDCGADANKSNVNGTTALWNAVAGGRGGIIRLLLSVTDDVNLSLRAEDVELNGSTALHIAVDSGYEETVIELLKKGANVNALTEQGESALIIAAREGHAHIIRLLIIHQADVNVHSKSGSYALKSASICGELEIVQELLAAGAVDKPTTDEISALHMAAHCGHREIANILINARNRTSDVNLVHSPSGYTPLICALVEKHVVVARLLVEAGADVYICDSSDWTPLHYTCQCKDLQLFDLVLSLTQDELIDLRTDDGYTPLMIAAVNGFSHAIKELLKRNASETTVDENGETVLMKAARSGSAEAISLILDHSDCFPNQTSKRGWTALHLASAHLHDHIILGRLMDITWPLHRERSSTTPMGIAAYHGNKDAVEVFLARGMPVDITSKSGETALYIAAESTNIELIELLIKNGAERTQISKFNSVPLVLALHDPIPAIVQALKPDGYHLLRKKADTILVNGANEAAKVGLELLKSMVEHEVSPAAKSCFGHTTLHNAAERRKVDCIRYLLSLPEMAPLVNETCAISDRTPLMYAVFARDFRCVEELVNSGKMDPLQQDFLGFSAFDYAFPHDKIRLALSKANQLTFQMWCKQVSSLTETTQKLRFCVITLIQFLKSREWDRAYEFDIKKEMMSILSEALIFASDVKNGRVAAEYVYGPPADTPRSTFCCLCLHTKQTHGYLCVSCPYERFCPQCKEDAVKMQVFGCGEHETIRIPSETWQERDPEHVNDKGDTLESWLEHVLEDYMAEATRSSNQDMSLVGQETFKEEHFLNLHIKYDYSLARTDIVKLLLSRNWTAISEHLLEYPRDVWHVDEGGNTLAILVIQDATDDQDCLQALSFLRDEGASMLDHNLAGESTVTLSCQKSFQKTTSYLLSHYAPNFAQKCSVDAGGIHSSEAVSLMINNSWAEALEFAVERHFAWASRGKYQFLQKLDLMAFSIRQMVEFLLQHDEIETSDSSQIQQQPFMSEFRRPLCGSEPDSTFHLSNCVHTMYNSSLKDSASRLERRTRDPVYDQSADVAPQANADDSEISHHSDEEVLSSDSEWLESISSADRIAYMCGFAGTTSPEALSIQEDEVTAQIRNVSVRYGSASAEVDLEKLSVVILSAKSGLLQAFFESQQAGICCDSFTILVDTVSGPGNKFPPYVRLVRISFRLVLDFLNGISRQQQDEGSSEIHLSEAGFTAATTIKSLFLTQKFVRGDSRLANQLELMAEVLQVLCMGFVSFVNGHCADARLPFLSTEIPATRFCGLQDQGSIYVSPKSMACIGDMLQRKLLVFGVMTDDFDDKEQVPDLRYLMTDAESMLEIWGPGMYVTKKVLGIGPEDDIVAVHLQNGYITLTGEQFEDLPAAHWKKALKATTVEASSDNPSGWTVCTDDGVRIDGGSLLEGQAPPPKNLLTFKPLESIIVGMLRPRHRCNINIDTSFSEAEPVLHDLGTSDEFWQSSIRQIVAAVGHGGLQVSAMYGQNLVPGSTKKSVIVNKWKNEHKQGYFGQSPWLKSCLQYLKSPHGVVSSICTGFAQRVPLREAVSEAWYATTNELSYRPPWKEVQSWNKFLADTYKALKGLKREDFDSNSTFDPDAELAAYLNDRCKIWEQVFIHAVVGEILSLLQYTGISQDHKDFRIAWLNAAEGAKAYEFPVSSRQGSKWVQFMQDNRDIATFAIFTRDCLVGDTMYRARCHNHKLGYAIPRTISLLSTKVFRLPPNNQSDDNQLNLRDNDYCILVCDKPISKRFACQIRKHGKGEQRVTQLTVMGHTNKIIRACEFLRSVPAEDLREFHLQPKPRFDISKRVVITANRDWRNSVG